MIETMTVDQFGLWINGFICGMLLWGAMALLIFTLRRKR